MDRFQRRDLLELLEHDGSPCVSLTMPSHRTGREIREDHIRLKNLHGAAVEQLCGQGMAEGNALALMKPVERLLADDHFFENLSDGLAIFVAPDFERRFRVPQKLPERCVVGNAFEVMPLFSLLQDRGRFHVLACSPKRVRLLTGSRFSIAEVQPEDLPDNLRDALQIDEYERVLQWHSYQEYRGGAGEGGGVGESVAMFHGHGGADPGQKKRDEIIEYLRRIDHALQDHFGSENDPLVFAGVESLFAVWKDACSYRELVDECVHGNPDELSEQELHDRAWPLVKPRFEQSRKDAIARLEEALGKNAGSREPEEILEAAKTGRVEALFVADGADGDGERRRQVENAARLVLQTDGTVHVVSEQDRAPVETLAAIWRY